MIARRILLALSVALLMAPVGCGQGNRLFRAQDLFSEWRFDEVSSGQTAPPGRWEVRREEDGRRHVLVQTSDDSTNGRFPLLIFRGAVAGDVDVSVDIKPISGKVDQAGGIVVRYQDKDNYYIVRSNALENNVRLYKVVDGKRIQFAGTDAKVPGGQWHVLKLSARGNHFDVSYDGQKLFEAEDSTFPNAGKVGLWTKADSVTAFDNLKIETCDHGR